MTAFLNFGQHLARNWFAWMLAALAATLFAADAGLLVGSDLHVRLSASGAALYLVPVLLVCMVLWATGVRLEATERDRERLRAELERAEALGLIGSWSYESGRFRWSQRAADILGMDAAAAPTLDTLLVRVEPADRAVLERAWRTAQAGARYRAEVSVVDRRGEQRRVLFEGRREQRDDGGHRLAGIVQDTSDRYRMDMELRQAMSYQRALLDNFPFMVWLKDRKLRFLAVNRPLARAAGLPHPDDACGLEDIDLWPPDRASRYREEDLAVLATRQPCSAETSVEDDGTTFWYETWTAPVVADDGELLGTVGYARDIGGRKRAEAALARSRDRFDMLGRLQARFIAGEPEDRVFPALLDILCELAGSPDGFLGEIVRDSNGLAHIGLLACRDIDWLDAQAGLIEPLLVSDAAGGESGEVVAAAADTPTAPGLVCVAVVSGGRLAGLLGLASAQGRLDDEILSAVQAAIGTFGLLLEAGQRERARQQAEAELTRHRDRLSALVESQTHRGLATVAGDSLSDARSDDRTAFLARVSHELRTPVHAILGFTAIALRGRPALCEVTRRRFDVIRQNGERLLAKVDELLELSRVRDGTISLSRAPCGIDALLDEAVAVLAQETVSGTVAIRRTGHLPRTRIDADRTRVLQMLHALIVHVVCHSSGDGEIELCLGLLNGNGQDGVLLDIREGSAAPIGIDAASVAPAVEADAGSSDIALVLCHEIAALHGGWIRVDATPSGLTARLWLPCTTDDDARVATDLR